MTYLLFAQALEPAFRIYRGATAVPGGSNRLAVAMIGYVTCSKNAWDIRHCVLNWNDIEHYPYQVCP